MRINLYDIFHTNTLRDRQTALVIINKLSRVPSSEPITLNFQKIIFASRSFCHELLINLKDRKNVTFNNMNEEVRKMMVVSLKKPDTNFKIPIKTMAI